MEENKTELGYCYKYPRPAVTTDVVLFAMVDSQMKVLLIQRGRDPYKGQWAFPGGFLNMDETAEVGALRELKEETGLELDHVRQFHTFTRLDRDPRGRTISIAYYELIDCQKVVGGDDAALRPVVFPRRSSAFGFRPRRYVGEGPPCLGLPAEVGEAGPRLTPSSQTGG